MAKRYGSFDEANSKRPKFDDVWGEELDADIIEECINLATEVCEKEEITCTQRNNVTILPTYSSFKKPNTIFTSTQVVLQNGYASASAEFNINSVEARLKELQEKCAEKEGEVSILRSNLRDLRNASQADQERKQNEWKEKLSCTQKELGKVKSQLAFKDLEIANWKQKMAEISKYVPSDNNTTITNERTVLSSPKKLFEKPAVNCKIQTNASQYFPLKNSKFLTIFKIPSDEVFRGHPKFNLCRYTIPYLQNQLSQGETDFLINLKPKVITVEGKELNLDYVYPELLTLISCSSTEFSGQSAITAANKVICVSLQLLTDFCDYLKRIEDNIELQEIQQADTFYLEKYSGKFDHRDSELRFFKKNEMGVKPAKLLMFLADLLPFSSYLSGHVLLQKHLKLGEHEDYVKLLPSCSNQLRPFHYLTLLLETVAIIGRIRKAQVCSGFLSCVVQFLTNAVKCNNSPESVDLICQITKEVLFARPDFMVMFRVTSLFEAASILPKFGSSLCIKAECKKLKTGSNKILYFQRDSCTFHIFVVLFENMLSKIDLPVTVNLSVLNFIYNLFKSNSSWLYEQDDKHCSCLCILYKLSIGIIYRILEKYKATKPANCLDLFRCSIKILQLLTFNSYDLTDRYVASYAQYREIIHSLSQIQHELGLSKDYLKDLEKLNESEEIPIVPVSSFAGIDF